MKKKNSNKLTNKEIGKRFNFLIYKIQGLEQAYDLMQRMISDYMDFKKDKEVFKKFLEEKFKKESKSKTQVAEK